MVLVQCPECGREISSDAVACPSCGKPTTRSLFPPPPDDAATKPARDGCLGPIIGGGGAGCLLVVVGVLFVVGLAMWGHQNAPAVPPGPNWVEIKTKCEIAIEARLKSPRTATFNWGEKLKFTDKDPKRSGPGYVGSVDSQNSFGAMLRTGFKCWVRPDGTAAVELDSR